MIMWLFLLIPLTTSSVYAEIITLSTQSSISCVVTKRDAEPAVYINPPIKSEFTQRQPEIDNWITKDWTPTSSLFSNHYPITDKRWEGFKLYDETYGGNLYNSSFSFSMCMYEYDTVTFTVMSEDFFNDTRLNFTSNTRSPSKNEKSCRWSHYTFERKENTVHLYSEEGMIVKTFHLDYIPYWLYFKRISNKVLWRLHNYTFRSANTISLNQEPDLDISFGDNLCLSMYVSVDSDCFLDINLKSEQGSSQNVTVNGLNVEGSFKTWHKVEIHAKNSGKAHLSFYRRHKVQGTTEGYWAVDDIRFCTRDTEVYQVELKGEKPDKYVCEVLTSSKQPVRDENVVLCDKAGFLGSECNLSCSTILGASYPNCENHRICQGGSNCFCSWGYQEPFCNQTCVSGTWGLFCKNKCPTECPSCHPSTGECLDGIKKMDIKIALNLREIPMPQNIKLVSNRIHVTLPDFEETEENITYDLQYFCDSGWCKDELVYNHTITVNSVDDDGENTYKFENLTPFTDYKAIVIARKSESARIYYSIKPDQLNPPGMNMSVYCNNETTLWVKFQLPLKTSESDYRLWYKKSDPDSRPMKLETLSRCEFWDGFVCGRIDNLTQGIDYSLIVERLEMDNQKWGLSEEISAKTAPQAPPAPPQNILVSYSSENETILSWEQPSIQYCPLTKFEVILMKKNEIMDYAVVAKKNQITYSQKISLEYQTPCSVDIYAVNHCKGEPSKINITLIPSNTMLSSKPTIQICSQESCRFMVPKPKLFNTESQFHLLITDKANEDTAIKTFKLKEKKGKIEVDSPSTISKLEEIDDIYLTTENKILSLGNNRSDALYLIEKSFDGIYHDYPVKDVKKDILTNSSWEIFLIVGLSIFATLFLLLLALHKLCSYYRVDEKRSQYHANTKAKHGQLEFDNKTEHVILIPAENLLLETSIDRNDFEHNTKNVWKGLEGQFRSLPAKVIKTISVALKNKNVNKNKDLQNLPYDHSRVILQKMDGMGTDNYINANYINGLGHPKAYIATQGPKFSTVRDFWRMIWQEQVQTIVMATNFVESKKRKCAEYWPQRLNCIFECGEMGITLKSEENFEHYDRRTLEMNYRGEVRAVQHYHLKWNPDQLTPLYPDRVVPLVKQIRNIRENSTTPIVIHCSSGVNRTGTLILCDMALQMATEQNKIDFYKLTKDLRDQRPNMVSTEKQYLLAHLVVLECLMEEENVFRKIIRENFALKRYKAQLNYLDRLHWHDEEVQSWIPYQVATPFSGIPVDGYAKSKKYVVLPQPHENSLSNFWDLVLQEKIEIILFLNESKCDIWPYSNRKYDSDVSVKAVDQICTNYCTTTELLLKYTTQTTNINYIQRVYLFQLTRWNSTEVVPQNVESVLNILDDIQKNYYFEKPILLACHDGIVASGFFAALSYIIEKFQKEVEFDICNGVRTVRRSCKQFVNTTMQMEFLYVAVLEYLQKFDSYSCIL